MRRRLQEQGRLSDSRLAAEQHQRTRHHAAAQDPIELGDTGRDPLGNNGIDVRVQLRPRGCREAVSRRPRRSRRCALGQLAFLDERVPGAALGASSRATWGTARRTPGRRRRLVFIGFTVNSLDWMGGSSSINPLYPRPQPAQQLVGDRPDRRGDLPHADRLLSLLAHNHHIVAGCHMRAGDVDRGHVHADRSHHRRAPAAYEHVATTGQPEIDPVRVPGRHDGKRGAAPRARFEGRSRFPHPGESPSPPRYGSGVTGQVAAAGSTPAEEARCRRAAARAARSRTRRAHREGAPRCWRRGGRSRSRPATAAGPEPRRTAAAAAQTPDDPGCPRSRSVCRPRRLPDSEMLRLRAACGEGCRAGSRADSSRCRS